MVFNKLLKIIIVIVILKTLDLPGSATDILTALLMGVFGVVLG